MIELKKPGTIQGAVQVANAAGLSPIFAFTLVSNSPQAPAFQSAEFYDTSTNARFTQQSVCEFNGVPVVAYNSFATPIASGELLIAYGRNSMPTSAGDWESHSISTAALYIGVLRALGDRLAIAATTGGTETQVLTAQVARPTAPLDWLLSLHVDSASGVYVGHDFDLAQIDGNPALVYPISNTDPAPNPKQYLVYRAAL
ncbi:MAG: hypothetical protein ABI743_12980, partial [bacterium]